MKKRNIKDRESNNNTKPKLQMSAKDVIVQKIKSLVFTNKKDKEFFDKSRMFRSSSKHDLKALKEGRLDDIRFHHGKTVLEIEMIIEANQITIDEISNIMHLRRKSLLRLNDIAERLGMHRDEFMFNANHGNY